MKLAQYVVGMVATNCYFAINEETNEVIVVDPGDNGDKLAEEIKKNSLKPVAILLTHGHCDHTNGIEGLKAEIGDSGLKAYALLEEKELLEEPKLNQSKYMGYGKKSYPADCYIKDGDELTLAGMSFKVIATPGHTPGGCCYYFENDNILFSGDTLFCQSVGRTDFPGGSMSELMSSIKDKLFLLPDDTVVLPGHNSHTTIGDEKVYNPFVA